MMTSPAFAAPTVRAAADAQAEVADWLQLIRAEYTEIPSLQLTRKQVQRLWSLDDQTCETLLTVLIDLKFLRLTAKGTYARRDVD